MLKGKGKKIAIFFLLGTIALSSAFSKEYILFVESCGTYNKYTSSLDAAELEIKYDSTDNVYLLYYEKLSYDGIYIALSEENLADLRSACEKYFEWEELARTKGVKIEKKLPITTLVLAGWSNYSGDFYCGIGELHFDFLSQSPIRHQLVIFSTKIEDIVHDTVGLYSRELEPLYFDKEDVQQLYNDISEEALKVAVEKVREQQKIENMFN